MRRTTPTLALTIFAAIAVAVGIVAFLLATPDQQVRVSRSDLGFRTLDRDSFDARFAALADARRAAARTQRLQRESAGIARRWFVALAGGDVRARTVVPGTGIAPDSPEARARVTALRRWADGIDPRAWRVTVAQADALADEAGAWAIPATLRVSLAQARSRTRVVQVPVVLELAAPVEAGRTWRVRDVQVDAPERGLRAYRDPVMVRSGGVDVVVPGGMRQDAPGIAKVVAAQLASLRRQLPEQDVPATLAAWGYEGATQLRAVRGARAQLDDDAHPIARVARDGDLLIDAAAWREATPAARNAALRHAAAHASFGSAFDGLPVAIGEGVAAAIGGPPGRSDLLLVDDGDGRDLIGLLTAAASSPLDGGSERARAHALGTWLLEQGGGIAAVRALAAQVEAGVDIDHAIRRVLHATPAGVAARVEAAVAATIDGEPATSRRVDTTSR